MFRLFRTIRRKLFSEGKVANYTGYAIGEIVLIMVGILLALQVSKWNQERNTRDKEIEILKSIHSELGTDLLDIEENIGIHESAVESARTLITHMENDLPYEDFLASLFFSSIQSSFFIHTKSSFETLKAKGVDLISNVELRNEIIKLYDGEYGYLLRFERTMEDSRLHSINVVIPGRFKEANNSEYLPEEKYVSKGTMIPVNYETLKNDNIFDYHIRTTKNSHKQYLEMAYYAIKEKVISLMEDIVAEVERLEMD